LFGYEVGKFFGKTWFFQIRENFVKKVWVKNLCFWVKNPIVEAKTGVSEHSEFMEYSEFVLFRIFQK